MADWDGMSDRRGDGGGLHPEARALFATIIERVDNLKVTFKEHTEEDDRRFKDHEDRLRKAEGVIGRATGYAMAVSAVIGAAGGWLGKKIGIS